MTQTAVPTIFINRVGLYTIEEKFVDFIYDFLNLEIQNGLLYKRHIPLYRLADFEPYNGYDPISYAEGRDKVSNTVFYNVLMYMVKRKPDIMNIAETKDCHVVIPREVGNITYKMIIR